MNELKHYTTKPNCPYIKQMLADIGECLDSCFEDESGADRESK